MASQFSNPLLGFGSCGMVCYLWLWWMAIGQLSRTGWEALGIPKMMDQYHYEGLVRKWLEKDRVLEGVGVLLPKPWKDQCRLRSLNFLWGNQRVVEELKFALVWFFFFLKRSSTDALRLQIIKTWGFSEVPMVRGKGNGRMPIQAV